MHMIMHGGWPLGPHIYGGGVSKANDPDRVQSEPTSRELMMDYCQCNDMLVTNTRHAHVGRQEGRA